MTDMAMKEQYSPYVSITRDEWKLLNGSLNFSLSNEDIGRLHALNEPLNMEEIQEVYFPLCHLLNIHIDHAHKLYDAENAYLNSGRKRSPFIIGIAGSVAAGKSTTARVLQKVLSLWPDKPNVALVTTDGFLYPNSVLEQRGIMNRKGFPESYDTKKLINFLADVKAGKESLQVPIYSHLEYDVMPDQMQEIYNPDIVIVEGINVLQVNLSEKHKGPQVFVSDFFDYSIYVHANEKNLLEWYVSRFRQLQTTAFRNPNSYFHRYASLSEEEAIARANSIWDLINKPNLIKNILPTRFRANLILEKGSNHFVTGVKLRKV
ncbi:MULTISPECIES: type I pantothenate kinase [Olivibacter]|jgi:type I pantothenate kinase|uniref:Pantothenate kinase n=3 Tax=Olivibacter TaxID=376469 RepID=A0ABV6HK72_9SPHI|nr:MULTISPECIES: type I pantothenate kinase [Olivibacter]MCL4640984.1 type I pantothenate kinase [Olivibacter sp. UJ_SKK_5.1]MDX3913027.1 type I pantothenate kinase [Pseudosphingobacterium sp.]QEL02060.1 type I pantothenate kinase [Olivibacter sp. LS-1]